MPLSENQTSLSATVAGYRGGAEGPRVALFVGGRSVERGRFLAFDTATAEGRQPRSTRKYYSINPGAQGAIWVLANAVSSRPFLVSGLLIQIRWSKSGRLQIETCARSSAQRIIPIRAKSRRSALTVENRTKVSMVH